jgi:hypothetical protein
VPPAGFLLAKTGKRLILDERAFFEREYSTRACCRLQGEERIMGTDSSAPRFEGVPERDVSPDRSEPLDIQVYDAAMRIRAMIETGETRHRRNGARLAGEYARHIQTLSEALFAYFHSLLAKTLAAAQNDPDTEVARQAGESLRFLGHN